MDNQSNKTHFGNNIYLIVHILYLSIYVHRRVSAAYVRNARCGRQRLRPEVPEVPEINEYCRSGLYSRDCSTLVPSHSFAQTR
ncbi:hypothetical protein J6590_085873 [Homalodisca vitripennis]|nr:hypothetical protein J6590_085873 [Homalodisca vitripennis]